VAVIDTPMELLKVRLQQNNSQVSIFLFNEHPIPKYSSIWDCARKSLRAEGLAGLYRGFAITTLRDIPRFDLGEVAECR
jgi:hypothetical protein